MRPLKFEQKKIFFNFSELHSVKKLARIIPVQRLHSIITYIVYRSSLKCFEFGYHEWDRVLFFIITTRSAIFKHLYIRENLVHISWIKLRIWFQGRSQELEMGVQSYWARGLGARGTKPLGNARVLNI